MFILIYVLLGRWWYILYAPTYISIVGSRGGISGKENDLSYV